MTLSPGTRVGSYEITAAIGAGGMGEVYRGRDAALNRDVAIKVLPAALAADAERLARFKREAQVLASLNHPNVAHVYGFEGAALSDGRTEHFLAMELVEGEDLSERLTRGAIPVDEAIAIAKQIAEALEGAHEHGIVHRDLKPANIKVRSDGTVKVLDFGLAKANDPGSTSAPPDVSHSPTLTHHGTSAGMIVGTAAYMSPEQARGKAVDKRADIWSFGVVFFEMLTGRRLFAGETVSDTLAAVLKEDVPWKKLPPSTPRAVSRLLKRCLTRDPRQRLRDIGEARLILASDLGADSGSDFESSRPTRTAMGWVVASVLLLLLLGSLFRQRSPPVSFGRPIIRYDVMSPAKTALRLDARPAVAMAPDGSGVVFVATADGVTRLYLKKRDDTEARALPGTEGGSNPALSPDGKRLAFAAPSQLMRMSLDGAPVALTKVNDPRGIAWLDDDTIVFTADTITGLTTVPASGGEVKALTTLDANANERTHRWPVPLSGGAAVLFTVGTAASPDNYDEATIEGVVVETGERRKVMQGASFVQVSPSGHLIYAKGGSIFAAPFDSRSLSISGAAVQVLQGVATDTTTGAVHASLAHDGTLAYVPGGSSTDDRSLLWVDRKGAASPLGLPTGLYNDPRVSPDGARVAVLVGAGSSGDVWIYDTRNTAFTRFTFDRVNSSPSWSRDGRTLYWSSAGAGGRTTTLFRKPADASREAESVGSVSGRAYLEAIDGAEKTAFLNSYNQGTSHGNSVVTLPIPGGSPTVLVRSRGSAYGSAISPDGRFLAYQSDEGIRYEIYVRELFGSGARYQVSTGGGEEPRWSADGGEIYYRNDTRLMAAKVVARPVFESKPPEVLFEDVYNYRTDSGITYDVDPRRGRFLMIRPASPNSREAVTRVRMVVNWVDEVKQLAAPK
jgi:serine/threonine protein kinase/Tol biopolymer transport system component